MDEVRLHVEPGSISPSTTGPATGNIELRLGGSAFPKAGWNDFMIVILEAWLSALLRIVRRESDAERVHFMEGPYGVDFARLSTGEIRVRALERPNRQRAVVDAPPVSLVENALDAADGVLASCGRHGQRTVDVDRLQAALAALRQEVPGLTN